MSAEGLNYSLSINKIAPIVRGFEETDYEVVVRKARLGVTVQEVSVFLEENAASLLPEDAVGVVVIDFDLTRTAYLVLEINDLIIDMNGTPIASIADIALQLEDAEFGDVHVVKVMRFNGTKFEEVIVNITLS
jgi:S1-C subfamily serine protease